MEVNFDARLPQFRKESHLRAVRSMSCNGQVTYQILLSSGDRVLEREVIARYLAVDSDGRDIRAVAITPANYDFRLKGAARSEPRIQVFQLKPRKKLLGLFRGELWFDTGTGMPILEAGQFVKNPSMLLKRIRFVREYEIRDGVSIPKRVESSIETRFTGRAELSVRFSNFTHQETTYCDGPEPNR